MAWSVTYRPTSSATKHALRTGEMVGGGSGAVGAGAMARSAGGAARSDARVLPLGHRSLRPPAETAGQAGADLAREVITRRHNICERLPRRAAEAIQLHYIRVMICSAVGTIRQQRRDGDLVPLACRTRSPM